METSTAHAPTKLAAHSQRLQVFKKLAVTPTDRIWVLLSQRIVVDDDLNVAITRTLLFDSASALHYLGSPITTDLCHASQTEKHLIVPVSPLDASIASRNEVEVASPLGTRWVNPLPFNWIESLDEPAIGALNQPLPVPITLTEFLSCPVLRLKMRTQKRNPEKADLPIPRIGPVSHITVSEVGRVNMTTVSLAIPDEARVDIAVIGGTLELRGIADRIDSDETKIRRRLKLDSLNDLQTIDSQPDDRGIWINALVNACKIALSELTRIEAAGMTNLKRSSPLPLLNNPRRAAWSVGRWRQTTTSPGVSTIVRSRRLKRRAQVGLSEVRAQSQNVRLQLDALTSESIGGSASETTPPSPDDIMHHSRALKALLHEKTNFTILVEKNGETLNTEAIAKPLGPQTRTRVWLEWISIPFTSKPQMRFHRGLGFLLITLAGLLLILAFLVHSLSSDLLVPSFLKDWFNSHLNTGQYRADGVALRTTVVTVLLLFPVVLYGALYQARPVTAVAKRTAHYLYFVGLFLFATPVVVAIFAATGLPAIWIWLSGYLFGSVALVAGIYIFIHFTTARLTRLRHKEAVRTLVHRHKRQRRESRARQPHRLRSIRKWVFR